MNRKCVHHSKSDLQIAKWPNGNETSRDTRKPSKIPKKLDSILESFDVFCVFSKVSTPSPSSKLDRGTPLMSFNTSVASVDRNTCNQNTNFKKRSKNDEKTAIPLDPTSTSDLGCHLVPRPLFPKSSGWPCHISWGWRPNKLTQINTNFCQIAWNCLSSHWETLFKVSKTNCLAFFTPFSHRSS